MEEYEEDKFNKLLAFLQLSERELKGLRIYIVAMMILVSVSVMYSTFGRRMIFTDTVETWEPGTERNGTTGHLRYYHK